MLRGKLFSSRNLIILSLLVFLVFLSYRIAILFYPTPDIGGVEGNIIYFVQRIVDGQSFYTDPAQPPYAIAQYPPLYYYLVAGAAKLAGIGADDVYSIFITGRIVSLLLNIGFILIVFFIAKRIFSISNTKSLVISVASFIFLDITSFARPDSLYHFVFILTLYFFLHSIKKIEEGKAIRKLAICCIALLSVISLFSKQTGILLPLIICGGFLMQKRHRVFFTYLFFYLLMVAIFLAGIQYFFGIGLFYKNAIIGINNGISIGWYRGIFIKSFYLRYGLIFLPAFVFILFLIRKESRSLPRVSGFTLLLLFIFLNGIGLKLGSVVGYLTEWWTLLFILLGFYWQVIVKAASSLDSKIPAVAVSIILLLKLLLIITPFSKTVKLLSSEDKMKGYREERNVAGVIKQKLSPDDKFVVFTNLYTPESFMSNFLFRHAVMPQQEIVSLSTYPQKKYDYSDFEMGLQNGTFKWMLMKKPKSIKLFFTIKLDKYSLTDSIGPFSLYRYKP